jgi:hypothetical protein
MWWRRRDWGLDKTSLGHSALRIGVLTCALPSALRAGRQGVAAPLRARRADWHCRADDQRRFCSTLPPGKLRLGLHWRGVPLGLHWRGVPCSVPRPRAAPRLAQRPRRSLLCSAASCCASPGAAAAAVRASRTMHSRAPPVGARRRERQLLRALLQTARYICDARSDISGVCSTTVDKAGRSAAALWTPRHTHRPARPPRSTPHCATSDAVFAIPVGQDVHGRRVRGQATAVDAACLGDVAANPARPRPRHERVRRRRRRRPGDVATGASPVELVALGGAAAPLLLQCALLLQCG